MRSTPNGAQTEPSAANARPHARPLLDARQAGELLNVPATWLLAEARADRIPYVRLGRYVRFDGEELEHWWRGRARGPWRSAGAAARVARIGSGPVPVGLDAA
jgi:excisionase family DNA binding protein